MARGHEDWNIKTDSFGDTSFDLTEMAARLGSPYKWSRSGRLQEISEFNVTWRSWDSSDSDGDTVPKINHTIFFSGVGSLQLENPTTSGDICEVEKTIPYIPNTLHGIEVVFYNSGGGHTFNVILDIFHGTVQHTYQVKVDFAGEDVYIVDDTGSDVLLLSSLGLQTFRNTWQLLKFVVNDITGFWDYLQIEGVTIDLSSYEFWESGVTTARNRTKITMNVETGGSGDGSTYVDSISYTIDEP